MKINLSNHKRIYAALDIANKGAKVRTLNWNQLLEHSHACEHRLASACRGRPAMGVTGSI